MSLREPFASLDRHRGSTSAPWARKVVVMRNGRCVGSGRAWRVLAALGLVTPLACSDDRTLAGVEVEPRCGGEAEVELVELGPGEGVQLVYGFDDDRVLVRIGTETEFLRAVVVSTCGGTAEPVSPGIAHVFEYEGVLLACDPDFALVQLRELGDPSPQVLVERGCANVRNEFGLVAFEAAEGSTSGRLLRLRVEGQTVRREPLLEAVRVPSYDFVYGGLVGDQALVTTVDGAVQAVNIVTGAVRWIADEATVVGHDDDLWLVHHDPGAAAGDGAVELVDRRTGEVTALTIAGPHERVTLAHGIVVVGLDTRSQPEVFAAADGHAITPPAGLRVRGVAAPGVLWLSRDDDDGGATHFRWREGEAPIEIASCSHCGMATVSSPDGALISSGEPTAPTMWFADAGGGVAQRVASAVGQAYSLLEDRRVLTIPGYYDVVSGPLLVYTPDDPTPQVLADDVSPWSTYLTDVYRGDPRDVLYETAPLDEVHALHLVRLGER